MYGFSLHIEPPSYLGVSGYIFKNIIYFCWKIIFTLTNNEDPDKMQHFAAFNLGMHCLLKYQFRGLPKTKGELIKHTY